jgi:hypothetical protein
MRVVGGFVNLALALYFHLRELPRRGLLVSKSVFGKGQGDSRGAKSASA